MDKEFLQYIEDMGYDDLLDMDEKNIERYKNTLHYQMWQLKKVKIELVQVIKEAWKQIWRDIVNRIFK